MKKVFGPMESMFFAYVQMRNQRVVRIGDLVRNLRWSAVQEQKLLSRLFQSGVIARVIRGVYLVPLRLPLGGLWSPGEALALNALMQEVKGRYQICGPNAFNRYGFSDQMPNRVYAYNNRLSGERKIGSVTLTLIKVRDSRLGDTELVSTREEGDAVYSSRVRTMIDAVYDWSRFRMLARAFEWICDDLARNRVTPKDLVNMTLKYGDTGTMRRMGALLEETGASIQDLRRLRKALKPTTGLIPWIPGRIKRGTINKSWGVIMNKEPART